MQPNKHEHQHEEFTIPMKPSPTEDQQEKAIELLKVAWVTVDFWDHKGDQSKAIISFINEVEGHTDWPKLRSTSK